MKKELADFYGNYASEQETADAIAKLYSDTGYVIDTHTAVAAAVYGKYREETYDETKTVIASTASPYKFTGSVLAAIAPEYDTPSVLEQVRQAVCTCQYRDSACDRRNPYCTGASYDRV